MSPSALFGRRSRALRVVLLVVFVVLMIRLVDVQEFSHRHYASLSTAELTQVVSVPALRGGIYDRNGQVLSESVIKQTVVADPFIIKDPAKEASELAPVLGVPAAQLRADMTEHSGFVYLARRVPAQVASKVSALTLPGINLIDESQRVQPDGQLALPVIGTVNSAGAGAGGLEYQYQSQLAGKAGTQQLLESPSGVALSSATRTGTAARSGTGLELTLDQSVQYVAEQALGAEIVASHATSGIAIVMDVKTGDILAEANLDATHASSTTAANSTAPSTTTTTAPPSAAQAARTLAAATSGAGSSAASFTSPVDTLPAGVVEAPSNSAVTQVYEPGSVFKLVTFSASLQDGIITPMTPFVVPGALPVGGYIFHDAEAHGTETLTASDILAQSSNIGTIEIASKLGETRLLGQIGHLGFGKPTGLNFPGESQGLVLGPAAWTGSSIGSTPIGQDDAVTAQQLVDAYNAVANGGVLVQPRLVRGFVNADGSVTPAPPSPTRRVIAPAIDSELTTMFEGVVTHGTGTSGAIAGYTVAGKTGTAQIPSPNHVGYTPGAFYGTFAGFAPAQAPVLSAVVVLEHPTPIYGGAVAAPVFAKIMEYALHHYGIPTSTTATTATARGAIGSGSVTVPPGAATEG